MLARDKLFISAKNNHPHRFQDMQDNDSRRYEVFICKSTFNMGTRFCIEVIRYEDKSVGYFRGSQRFDTLEELEINLSMNFPDCVIEECNDPEECMLAVKGIKKEVLDNAFMNHMMLV